MRWPIFCRSRWSRASLIRENKTFRIPSDIQTGASLGMITMDTHLMSLYNKELITADEAVEKAQDPIVIALFLPIVRIIQSLG